MSGVNLNFDGKNNAFGRKLIKTVKSLFADGTQKKRVLAEGKLGEPDEPIEGIDRVPFDGISIYCLVSSATIDSKDFIFNPKRVPTVFKEEGSRGFILATLRYNNPYVQRLLGAIFKNDILGAQDILKERYDPFYIDCRITVITKGYNKVSTVKTVLEPSAQTLKNEKYINKRYLSKRFYDPISKSYKELKSVVKAYNLRAPADEVKNLPYLNFDNNKSDINCVLNFAKQKYPMIKKLSKYFNKDVEQIETIEKFCDDYKIRLVVYNLDETVILSNGLDTNKHYPDFVIMAVNNHLCPRIDKSKKAELSDEVTSDVTKIDINNDIVKAFGSSDNLTLYNKSCCIHGKLQGGKKALAIIPQMDQKDIDNEFFRGMATNFLYKSDCLKMKALMYTHDKISTLMVCEHDIKKAYFNIAHNIIDKDSLYPIFTAQDMWTKYQDDEIEGLNCYLLNNRVKDMLSKNGSIINFHNGHFVEYLLEKKLIKKSDITAVKVPSEFGVWSDVIKRMDSLAEKNPNVSSDFIFYNGLLGKTHNRNTIQYTNVKTSDIDIMEGFYIHDDYGNGYCTVAKQCDELYRYINHVNIYNHIVETTSLYLLMYRDRIVELNPGVKIVKIKVDALGFDRVVKIPEEYEDMFKYLDRKTLDKDGNLKMYTEYLAYGFDYHSFIDINKGVAEEMKAFENNISYFGAPGTGKTYTVKNNKDLKYDYACTWTNVCSLNLKTDAKDNKVSTVYSLLNLYNPGDMLEHFKRYRNKTIWIDEFSMISLHLWNYFALLSLKFNTKFIITGDINQIPPINEKEIDINNKFVKAFFNKTETLKEDFRNGKDLIELRDNILEGKANIKYSKEDYTKYDFHIVALRETRSLINSYIMKERKYVFKYIYNNNKKVKGNECGVEVSPGVLISPRKSLKSRRLFKGDIWKVVKKTKGGYVCSNYLRDEEHEFLQEDMLFMHLAFAVTCHSIQGATIREKFCIHETDRFWDKKLLYTAVTRGIDLNNINIYRKAPTPPKNFDTTKDIITFSWLDMSDDEEYEKFDKIKLNN